MITPTKPHGVFVYLVIPATAGTGLGFHPEHIVIFGSHVLEDTHETRDGWPMSVYKSFLSDTYTVIVDTNDYS